MEWIAKMETSSNAKTQRSKNIIEVNRNDVYNLIENLNKTGLIGAELKASQR